MLFIGGGWAEDHHDIEIEGAPRSDRNPGHRRRSRRGIEQEGRLDPPFVDHLYLSTTNSSAFSPTDTMPLTSRTKILNGHSSDRGADHLTAGHHRAVGALGGGLNIARLLATRVAGYSPTPLSTPWMFRRYRERVHHPTNAQEDQSVRLLTGSRERQ